MLNNLTLDIEDSSLLRLMQLSSVSLPVGGYSFSQGLEYAIDTGWLKKAVDVESWVSVQLSQSVSTLDLPILIRVIQATKDNDLVELFRLNDVVLACRETHELRLTDTAMGDALLRVLQNLDIDVPFTLKEDISFVTLYGFACAKWNIKAQAACLGFAWAWLENQIAAATKLVPLGQTQAQQLLSDLQLIIPDCIAHAQNIDEDDIGAGLPALAIASCQHEIQYSRLFRS